ncbi:hypothetical protein ACFRQM_15280 [Streptomyces sp. NPDC056831]|uniref:hypothetical protein n=1 Tax=Streptomyces sp. NPDC056831 TaxID=3345954 RepID=UPI0036CA24E0
MATRDGALVAMRGYLRAGHLALQYAHRLGHDVAAIARVPEKEQLAEETGAPNASTAPARTRPRRWATWWRIGHRRHRLLDEPAATSDAGEGPAGRHTIPTRDGRTGGRHRDRPGPAVVHPDSTRREKP